MIDFTNDFKEKIAHDYLTNTFKKNAVMIIRAYYVYVDLSLFGFKVKDIENDRLDCLIEYITLSITEVGDFETLPVRRLKILNSERNNRTGTRPQFWLYCVIGRFYLQL